MKPDGKIKWYESKINVHITRVIEILLALFVVSVILYIIITRFLYRGNSYLTDGRYFEMNDGWTRITEDDGTEESEEITIPYITSMPSNEKLILENTIGENVSNRDVFSTRIIGQEAKIYIGGRLRYEVSLDDGEPFRQDMYGQYIFIQLRPSDARKTIKIVETKPVNGARKFTYCYYGDKSAITIKYLRDNGFALGSGLFFMIIGAICGLTGIFMHFLSKNGARVAYVGAALFLIALWDVTQSDFRDMLFANIKAISLVPCFCLAAFPVAVCLYFNKLQKERYAGIYNLFILTSVADFAIQLFLQIAHLRDLLSNVVILFVFIFAAILILFYTIYMDYKRGLSNEYAIVILGTMVLTLSGIGQMFEFMKTTVTSSSYPLLIGTLGLAASILSHEITEYNRLNAEKHSAEKAAQMKSDFLATMSHEIRTPINAVLGMNEMILREASESNIRDYATDVDSAGHVLLTLINDILDFSKLDSGKMNIVVAEYSVKSLVLGAVKMIKPRVDAKGLEFKLDVDPSMPGELIGDVQRVNQIMINLLTNAAKYTSEGSVTLKVFGEGFGKDFILHFSVIDTGKGIKKEDKDKLFDAFTRVDEASNSSIEGTGLGLSIVKSLIRLMHGKITVESEYGKGSEFSVSIPQEVFDNEPVGDIAATSAGKIKQKEAQKNMIIAPDARILAVDDTALNLKVVKSLLNKTKIQVDTCQSGEECIKMISENWYDMILLDHMMPGMDGIETFKRMKEGKMSVNQCAPVIMLTANAVSGVREEFLSMGFDDYLSKPFTATELQKMLIKYLPEDKCQIIDN